MDSDRIHFSIGLDGKVSADVKDGSITEEKFQPNFLADCENARDAAEGYADEAEGYRDDCASYLEQISGQVMIYPKGRYDPDEEYDPLDFVYFNNGSYLAKRTTQGNLPTDEDYWQLVVSGPYTLAQTLTAGQTSVTFTDPMIDDNAHIKVYTSKMDLLYNSIVKTGTNSVTIYFPEQSENVTVQIDII